MTDEELFALRDAYLAEHPEVGQVLRMVTWYAWAQRQIAGARCVEQIWQDGKLVSERDVTPPDPEPPL